MANRVLSGGPISGPMVSFTAKGAWTDPAVGDLVIFDITANYNVDECADTELPIGIVRAVGKDGVTLTIERFVAGSIARLPHDTVALGDKVSADATKGAGYVDTDAAGIGTVVAINIVSGYADIMW